MPVRARSKLSCYEEMPELHGKWFAVFRTPRRPRASVKAARSRITTPPDEES